MNNRFFIIATTAACLFAGACKKATLPPDLSGDPQFRASFTLPSPLENELVAGENGVYLFTRQKFSDSVLTLVGAFAPATCPDATCPGSLTFELRSKTAGADFDLATSLPVGGKEFFNQTPEPTTVYAAKFTADGGGPDAVYRWKIGPVLEFQGKTVEHIFTEMGDRTVVLSAKDAHGIESFFKKSVTVVTTPDICPNAQIALDPQPGQGLSFTAESDQPAGAKFNWNTGSDAASFHLGAGFIAPAYTVTVTTVGGCTAVASVAGLPPQGISYSLATPVFDYSVHAEMLPGDLKQFGSVVIQYVDSQGVIWRSDRHAQKAGQAEFTIDSVENYLPNEHGEKTVKLSVRFKCLLFDASGANSVPIGGSAVLAVARP